MSDTDSESLSDLQQPGQQQDEDWEDWDNEEDEGQTQSLFSSTILPSPELALAYDAQHFSFDLRQYMIQHRLSEYDVIRVINYTRAEVAAGRDPLPTLAAAAATPGTAQPPWQDDQYLIPVLPDDPLLAYDFVEDMDSSSRADAGDGPAPVAGASSSAGAAAAAAVIGLASSSQQQQRRVAELEEEVEALRLRLATLSQLPLLRELMEGQEVDDPPAAGAAPSSSAAAETTAGPGPSSTAAAAAAGRGMQQAGGARGSSAGAAVALAARSRVDQLYFESYSYFDIHREMLGDKARTEAYRDALTLNPSLLKGARVLDVGCGTGILSMCAARGGAAAVVALEASERMAGFARQVVAGNGLGADQGGPVSVVQGKVEEVEDIGMDKVDVIVSEWMGYALLFETMLDSVLVARDRWLRPGGAMLPDVARVVVAGAGEGSLDLDFWKDVYGFSMAPIAEQLRGAAVGKVHVREVPASSILTQPATLHTLHLDTMTPDQQDFTAELSVTLASPAAAATQAAAGGGTSLAALVLWFDVEFSGKFCVDHPVTLSTSPAATPTHWMQAVMPLQPAVVLGGGDGAVALAGRLSMARSKGQHRVLDISLEYGAVTGSGEGVGPRSTAVFTMEVTGE